MQKFVQSADLLRKMHFASISIAVVGESSEVESILRVRVDILRSRSADWTNFCIRYFLL